MECRRIVMNYTVPPGLEDVETIAEAVFETLPDEITRHCEDMSLNVEDFVDDIAMADIDIDDPFELFALFRSGKEISPGVEKKNADEGDVLILYRRPILDMWCETEDDLETVIRQVVIEELGRAFDFSDDDVHEMMDRLCA